MSADLEPDQSPWSGRGFIAAAVVLGVIVALGMAIVVSNLIGGAPDTSTPVTGSADGTTPDQAVQAGQSPSVCGLTDVALTGTVDQPPAAEWSLLGTIAVPSAEGVGPGVVHPDGFRYCYAHTPEGALFMVANGSGVGAMPLLSRQLAEHAIAAGPGRQAAIADAGKGSSPNGAGVRIQIAGFRILSYTGDRASVDLAFRASTGAIAVQAFDLVWEDGDWKVQVTDDGELTSDMAQVPDLTGYIPWGGA